MFLRSKSKVETPESLASACRSALQEHQSDVKKLYMALEDAKLETLYFGKHGGYRTNNKESETDLLQIRIASQTYLKGIEFHGFSLFALRAKFLMLSQSEDVLTKNLNALDAELFCRILKDFEKHVGESLESDFRNQCGKQLESYFTPFDALEESLSAFIREQDAALQVVRELRERLVRRSLALSALVLAGVGFFALWYSVTQKQSTASVSK